MSNRMTVADRRNVPEVAKRPQRLAFKGAEQAESANGTVLSIDEAEGIVTAIVSVTGCEDEVADIIEPGAYTATLVKRRPKVCWAHSWEQPIGRVLHIEELMPGDPRLPDRQRDGKAWPTEAGVLVATMQFNLLSTKGREAFAAVVFYSETGECEYSIGYQARKAWKDKAGVRHIKSLDLFELSVVLFGAHTMTGTLSIKAATAAMHQTQRTGIAHKRLAEIRTRGAAHRRLAEVKSAEGHTPPQGVRAAAKRGLDLRDKFKRGGTAVGVARARDLSGGKAVSAETISRMVSFFARHEPDKSADGWGSTSDPSAGYIAWLLWGGDAGQAWAKKISAQQAKAFGAAGDATDDDVRDDVGSPDDDKGKAPDFTDGVMVAVYPDATAADEVLGQISGPDVTTDRDDLHVTLAYLGTTGEVGMESEAVIRAVTDAIEGMPKLEGQIAGIGMFPADPGGNGAPTWAPVDVPGLGMLREAIVSALGDQVRTDHGFTPHMTLGYGIGMIEPITPVPVEFTSVRVVWGTQEHDITLGQPAVGEPEGKEYSAAERRRKPTMPGDGDRYPIGDVDDLRNAIQNYGRGTDADKPKIKRWIKRRARELGAEHLIPDSWSDGKSLDADTAIADVCPGCGDVVYFDTANGWQRADGSYSHEDDPGTHSDHLDPVDDLDEAVEMSEHIASITDDGWWGLVDSLQADGFEFDEDEAKSLLAAIEAKAITPGGRVGNDSPVGTPGGRQNWVDKAGGLPRYIRMVAHALIRQGKSKSRAIAIAVATMKRWAANASGKVTAKVQAAAAKALAQWEAMKASTKKVYDPSLDRKGLGDPVPAGGGSYPYLEGSMEQVSSAIQSAVCDALYGDVVNDEGKREWDHVSIVGTWAPTSEEPGKVIARRIMWTGGEDRGEVYKMTYRIDGDGAVHLGDPDRISLQIVAVTDDGEEVEVEPDDVAESVHADVARVGGLIAAAYGGTEGKAGRVLSGRNERALREATVRLIEVLEAAGVRITLDDDDKRVEERTPGDHDEDARVEVDPDVDVESTAPSATRRSRKDLRGGGEKIDVVGILQHLRSDPLLDDTVVEL